jgi:general secretion pathway protein K
LRLGRKGTILVASFWLLAILSMLAIGIAFRISLEARLNRYFIDGTKALYLAKAAVYKAKELLSRDTNAYDSLRECGVILPREEKPEGDPAALFVNMKLGEGSFSVVYKEGGAAYPGMADEERRININTASQETLERLLGTEKAEVASAIIDWRDADDAPLPKGAENEYYQLLEHPYACKNASFTVTEEMLLVKGMTPELFNSIKDYVTVFGAGKVNVNTASERVFVSLGMTDALSKKIVDFRSGSDGISGTADDNVFTSVDIESVVPALSNEEVFAIGNLKNSFTTKSDYFKIEAEGSVEKSRTKKKLICVIKRDEAGAVPLIYYREL